MQAASLAVLDEVFRRAQLLGRPRVLILGGDVKDGFLAQVLVRVLLAVLALGLVDVLVRVFGHLLVLPYLFQHLLARSLGSEPAADEDELVTEALPCLLLGKLRDVLEHLLVPFEHLGSRPVGKSVDRVDQVVRVLFVAVGGLEDLA